MTNRKKPGVAFWATVAMSAVVLYLLSSGPAFSISEYAGSDSLLTRALTRLYSPLSWIYHNGPQPAHDLLDWWIDLWP